MTHRELQAVLGVTLLAMLACSLPTSLLGGVQATPASGKPEAMVTAPPFPVASGAECLVGTWELADLFEFMASALPPRAKAP